MPLPQTASLQVADGQTFPQLPQLLVFELVLTQAPPQQVPVPPPEGVHVPPGFGWQVPLVQVWQVGQEPQLRVPPQPSEVDPQFLPRAAQVVGVQQVPLVQIWAAAQQLLPQVLAGAAQAHLPLTQVKLAPHATPQAPQLPALVLVLTQVPLQQVVPMAHLWPHAPQLLLVVRLVHVPEQFVCPLGQVQVVPEQVQPFGPETQMPAQQMSPLQHELPAGHAPPDEMHLLLGAVGDDPEAVSAAASLAVRKGNMVPATVAARIFRALRRETGFASFLARSSKRSALMRSSSPPRCSR